jgi:hypothetical protein
MSIKLCKVMVSMSRSRPPTPPSDRPAAPQAAIEALLAGEAGNPGQPLLRRALWLEALDRQIRPFLPAGLAAHARLANLDNGRLVYLVDAPVWHARLRLAATEVLDAARSIGLDVTELVVKTAASPSPLRPTDTATTMPSMKPLSAAAQDALRAALGTDDGETKPETES